MTNEELIPAGLTRIAAWRILWTPPRLNGREGPDNPTVYNCSTRVGNAALWITGFEPRHGPEVKGLVTGGHEEFGFAYDPRLDADLDRIEQTYGGRGGFWVALDGGAVVGTVALLERTRWTVELKRMYLLPAYRGRGIGLALLRHAVGNARRRGFGEVILDTTPGQHEAARLYELCGFRRVGECGETLFYRLVL